MFLIFDTETTGLPLRDDAPLSDLDNWPRVVQLAWQVHDAEGRLLEDQNFLVQPDGFDIPFNATKVHGISTALAQRYGKPIAEVLSVFEQSLQKAKFVVGHNVQFDLNAMGAEYLRYTESNPLEDFPAIDTSEETRDFCKLAGGKGGGFKMPKLEELYSILFEESFAEAHNAAADVEATTRAFLELVRRSIFSDERLGFTPEMREAFNRANPDTIQSIGLKVESFKALSRKLEEESEQAQSQSKASAQTVDSFVHLHVHTQYSILQATVDIASLIQKAKEFNMPAVAMTDFANLYGAFQFTQQAIANDIKPIVGCEFYLCRDHRDKSVKDNGFQQVFLAKNKSGYHNLAKLSSHAFVDGYYYVPRIDKELLLQYKEHLIATTGNLYGEVPSLILNVGEKQAEEAFAWYVEHFGEDFYAELLNHGKPENQVVNKTLLQFCAKYGVKYFASNDVYYLQKEDANAHDILLCVKEGEFQSTPKGRGRGYRYGLMEEEYYFKSPEEMQALFPNQPEALATTLEIAEKIESYSLARDVLLPAFDIPEEFIDPLDAEDGGKRGENAYLRHLTYEGAKKRYGTIDEDLSKRLDFELETIANTGYPGYFLIVQDFTSQARKMGVSVGPGRGSAAGSVVAYCIGITNVDPIKYDLLFERFLNPDRVSLPDIDIDFDDEGRSKIIDWVVNKYGKNQVAQIITYGTMAAKSAIRDTGRVMQLPLNDTNQLAKLVPGTKLAKLFAWSDKEMAQNLNSEDLQLGKELKEKAQGNNLEAQVVQQARIIEGSVRNTGIHACGVIITPDDITKFVPVATAKDSDLLVTQFDNSVVESAGMLKMDFLGLKTLSIIKDAIKLVKERHGVEIDPDEIPLDDAKTFELYQRGETNGTFQFESAGMQKHLKGLKPDKFGDLIAMNALYRPGPLEYIPNFIARKHGKEPISYDLPEMEEYLAETYGITVYQEQVMLLSQKLAGFTKGEADVLRKAMGKKQRAVLDKMKPKFIEQGTAKGHDAKILEKVWTDWEAFAAYAFNKSHSTCYSVVAFHTGYLKANYPAEYMASVLTHNMSDIKKVTFFMEECNRMGIPVLGPDVNESALDFTVNAKGEIRFGLAGMKGVGESAVQSIVQERKENGAYSNIYDLLKRIDPRSVNKKTLENLILGGAMDCFENTPRATYFHQNGDERNFLEMAMKYAQNLRAQEESSQVSLFGESTEVNIPEPQIPTVEEWPRMLLLNKEKEINGIYLSSHPLDDFKYEFKFLIPNSLSELEFMPQGRPFRIGGMITEARIQMSKNGNEYGIFKLEDFSSAYEFFLFGEQFLKYKMYLVPDLKIFIEGFMEPRFRGSDELKPKISRVVLLSDLMQETVQAIQIGVPNTHLNAELMENLKALTEEFPGDKPMQLQVRDVFNNGLGESRQLELEVAFKGQMKLQLSTELLSKLTQMKALSIRLN